MRALVAGLFAVILGADRASAVEPFPVIRPATRAQAVLALSGGAPLPVPCMSSLVESLVDDPSAGSPAVRRALTLLQTTSHLHAERRLVDPDGTIVRFTLFKASYDRIDPADEDGDGRPDLIQAVLSGISEARHLLGYEFGLPVPDSVEVLLAEIGGNLEGYTIPAAGTDGRPLLVLDPSPDGGPAVTRAAAIHQYAHAALHAMSESFPLEWSEALATWASVRIDGLVDDKTAQLFGERLQRMNEGLETDSLELAAGNALWLAFLDEAYGPAVMRGVLDELSTGRPVAAAFDFALRRATGTSIASAFRDFQLWTLLVGERSNGRHFSFAERLERPAFSSENEGLPALSVRTEPAIGPLGAAAVLLRPAETQGGLGLRFEGETPGRWEADVVIVSKYGSLHRVPMTLDPDGRGRLDLPLAGVSEAILLVRSLDAEPDSLRRYAWSAQSLEGYPFELSALGATRVPGDGTVVAWETAAEHGLIGFNVLRFEEGQAAPVRVNPVWIPAMGDDQTAASYHFLDGTALPSVAYAYRIEGITETGLNSLSETIAPRERPARR